MSELFWVFLSAMVINNFTLALFLGLCPFMGVSARVETALRSSLLSCHHARPSKSAPSVRKPPGGRIITIHGS